jgi:molybdate/tungstate transport system substrate-binding protein
MKKQLIIGFTAMLMFMLQWSCNQPAREVQIASDTLKGDLIIFHAGSLAVPVKEVCDSFMLRHPEVHILTEAAGSKDCARKISDLHKPCDVMLSADHSVIDQLLIPEFATWNIRFATNEMAIVYTEKSHYADQINVHNFYELLLKKDVAFARSNPDSDPCGVRAVLTCKLAEIFYKQPGLSDKILAKDQQYIRPKETDLLALLESNAVDYIFLYRSVAMQHHLKYLVLPDEINLKSAALADYYSQVSVQTLGKKPGEYITEKGAPMVYGLTIPKNAPNPAVAIAFVEFLLGPVGTGILEKQGQPSIVPFATDTYNAIPDSLKKFATAPTKK